MHELGSAPKNLKFRPPFHRLVVLFSCHHAIDEVQRSLQQLLQCATIMTTPEARNQLEKLDILLSKVDAVRFALPEIVDFFTGSTARTSSVPQDPQTSVLEYRDRVKKAERSIAELQTGAVALGGMFRDFDEPCP